MATFKAGAARNLPIADTGRAWDGPAAQQRIFDLPEAQWKRAHLIYDADAPELRGSYKLPFADVLDGELTVIPAGLRAAASRLPQTDAPQAVLDAARAILDVYFDRLDAEDEAQGSRGAGEQGKVERRVMAARGLRAWLIEGAPPVIQGYAALFNSASQDLGGFIETIRPGAFAETIAQDDVRALWQHNPEYVLGRNRSGTLALAENGIGLRIEATPPETQWARDALVTIQRGDVDQMSFGFQVLEDDWSNPDGLIKRELIKVRLFDVSPVTFPAYNATTVSVRRHVAELSGARVDPEPEHIAALVQARARVALRRKRLELVNYL